MWKREICIDKKNTEEKLSFAVGLCARLSLSLSLFDFLFIIDEQKRKND